MSDSQTEKKVRRKSASPYKSKVKTLSLDSIPTPEPKKAPKKAVKTAAPADQATRTMEPVKRTRSAKPASAAASKPSAQLNKPTSASAKSPARAKTPVKPKEKGNLLRTIGLFLFFLFCLVIFTFSVRFLVKSIRGTEPEQTEISETADTRDAAELKKAASAELSAEAADSDASAPEAPTEEAETAETESAETPEEKTDTLAASASPVSITISLCGDCTLGNEESFAYSTSLGAYYDEYGPSYFFENVKDIFEKDDLTIANLECSFTEATVRGEHTYCFKAPASYSQILLDGSIEAVNLANNHTKDWLEQGYNDTRAALDDASIVHFGYEETAVMDVKGIKVGLVGTYELIEGTGIETELQANIEKVREEGAQIVIVVFHWGDELDLEPRYNQLYLAHKAVDFGADLVCGGHAHVLQGIENYKGKNILYGMANFCFGGNVYPHDMDTIIYQQTFTVDENGLVDDLVTNIIPCITSSDSSFNNYQPTPAEGDDAQRILDKLEERSNTLPEFDA